MTSKLIHSKVIRVTSRTNFYVDAQLQFDMNKFRGFALDKVNSMFLFSLKFIQSL